MGINFCPHCGGNLQGMVGTGFASCPEESSCAWKKANGIFTCAHGVRQKVHPNGWCDQGCCR